MEGERERESMPECKILELCGRTSKDTHGERRARLPLKNVPRPLSSQLSMLFIIFIINHKIYIHTCVLLINILIIFSISPRGTPYSLIHRELVVE